MWRVIRTLGNTPEVLAALDLAAVSGNDLLSGTNDGEGHSLAEDARMLRRDLVVRLNGGLVGPDALHIDNVANLRG